MRVADSLENSSLNRVLRATLVQAAHALTQTKTYLAGFDVSMDGGVEQTMAVAHSILVCLPSDSAPGTLS